MAEKDIKLVLSSANVIDAIHNEERLWNAHSAATEDDKESAWLRIAHTFGMQNGRPYN